MTTNSPYISVISPVYGCQTALYELYIRLKKTLEAHITSNFEIILVNDASPDNAWEAITELAGKDHRVKGINLSRNFGQHSAITAGLEKAEGQWVIVMDCDLQDQPEEISQLYAKAQEGYNIVLGRRENRNDNFLKRQFSKYFYKILAYLTDTKQDSSIANFGIYQKKVIKEICRMGDYARYFPAMVRWVGFKTTSITIEHAQRKDGKTSYNFKQLFNLGISVILSFSDKPLRLSINMGLTISFLSVFIGIGYLVMYFTGYILVLGFTSLIISIWFLSGIIISLIGMTGLYLGKVFEKVKNRPVYVVDTTINLSEKDDNQ